MDANEFLQKVTPAAQKSRLAPFWKDISNLRQKGCTLGQVCEFLAANGVEISIAGLSKYIKRQELKVVNSDKGMATRTSTYGNKPESKESGINNLAQSESRAKESGSEENKLSKGNLAAEQKAIADAKFKAYSTNPLKKSK